MSKAVGPIPSCSDESKALAISSLAEKTPELPEVGSPVDTPSSGSKTSGISPFMAQLAIEDGECGASIPSLNCIDELGKLEPTAAAPEKEKKKIKKRKVKKCKCCVAGGEAAASPKKKVLKKSKSKKGHAAKALPKDKSEEDAGKVLGSMLVGADATDVKDAKFVEEVTPKKKKNTKRKAEKDDVGDVEAEVASERKKSRKVSPIETSKEHSTQGAVASLGDAIKKKLAENGDFATGAVLSIPETGICRKCNNRVARTNARLTGKQCSYWVCKVCHSRSNQLRMIYSEWPPKNFEILSESQKIEFFNKIKETSNSRKLKLLSESFFATTVNDATGKKLQTEYLPLSVWKERGFDENEVMRSKDTLEDPLLGTLYGIELITKYVTHEERQERADVTEVTDRVPPIVPTVGKPLVGASAEDRQAAKEVVHIN